MFSRMRRKLCVVRLLDESFEEEQKLAKCDHFWIMGPQTRDEATMMDIPGSMLEKVSRKVRLSVKSLKTTMLV